MFSLCYYTAGLPAWTCQIFRPKVAVQLIFTSHFSSCSPLIYLLGIHASELGLVDGHPLKGRVLHCTRTQFHGCLDSARTMTWVIGFPKAYTCVSASVPYLPNEWSRHRKVACMFFSQSFALVCFESVIQKCALLNNVWLPQTPQFFSNTAVLWNSLLFFCQLSIISWSIYLEFKTSVLLNFSWSLLEVL